MRLVVSLAEARDAGRFGGKAAQLAALGDVAGVRVPAGFAIDAAAFEAALAALPASEQAARVIDGDPSLRRPQRLEAIRQRVLGLTLPAALREEILTAYRALGEGLVAVRSSALHEDGNEASAAGLQETILGVEGEDALFAAVSRCYASIYNERAVTYLARRKRPAVGRVAMAVVVQRLVRADAAGVLFTVDPVSGSRDVMVVESAFGLGCAVVDGGASPDVFRVDRKSRRVVSMNLGEKREAVLAVNGAVTREILATERQRAASICDSEITALVDTAAKIESAAGAPRDIEWAFEAGELWVLQARPVVGMRGVHVQPGARGSLDDRATWVWSNVNVGEALPGVATPLTWSIAAAFSDVGFRRAFGALGCEVPDGIELVGNFHGRIYLNLTNFMRIARQVPALSPRMLLEFGGGGGLDEIEKQVEPGAWGPFLARLPATGVRYIAENTALDRRIEGFERDFAEMRRRIDGLDLAALKDREVSSLLGELLVFLDRTGAVMLTCASGYLASVVGIRTLLRVAVGDEADRFERELLAGFLDLESAAPGVALFHIAEVVRGDPPARAAIMDADASSLALDGLPAGPTRRAFASFLKAYGYRCPREAELSTPRWRESPGTLFAALRAFLVRGDASPITRFERQHVIRAGAEEALTRRLPPFARAVARHLLARTQRFARLRERMRARVTEVLGFFRTVALDVSARMESRSPGVGRDAAFYLAIDEVRAWLGGELGDPSALVHVRRVQVIRDASRPDPPPVFVGAPPPVVPVTVPAGDVWSGVAASPGVVTGVARVLRDPADGASLKPGEVLVTPVADVGWTPLFLTATAVVTELGGALSHAALVAREYGVPAVVNVAGVTRVIRTGDRVRVDGDRGVIERLPSETPCASATPGPVVSAL